MSKESSWAVEQTSLKYDLDMLKTDALKASATLAQAQADNVELVERIKAEKDQAEAEAVVKMEAKLAAAFEATNFASATASAALAEKVANSRLKSICESRVKSQSFFYRRLDLIALFQILPFSPSPTLRILILTVFIFAKRSHFPRPGTHVDKPHFYLFTGK
jgi:hypothetical protein